MKLHKQIILILIVFFKTETLFSEIDLFNVNNIEIEKNDKINSIAITDLAIKNAFKQLIERILLKDDIEKLSDINFVSIKELVTYYQVSNISDEKNNKELVNYSVTFDKDKMHELFFNRGISYSEISNKELYFLPLLIKDNEIYVFNNNYFYDNWQDYYKIDLIEFILPLENIEIIQNINKNKNNLIDLNLNQLFKEYSNKNLALILIEDNKANLIKIYIKTRIQGKNISKSLNIKKQNLSIDKFYEKTIIESKKEIINLIKSKNLIDIRTPSFLNVKLDLNEKSNLVELNSRIKNIELIKNVYVQEFNNNYMNLRIKYLGKLEKIINQLKKENIKLQLINDLWIIKTL